ncbi:FecCD family ABC transporter permease [Streptantibioticus cattleyicolor]|uniref:Fe uptake system integral membrane protein n=1 Tax=Streptantibioticus cattleyicolor (strain ATCC 35852 / DSM 46488 / JCM 4925 / NBRC 14057 / NRRL 8057) TaxID=1003195 RepID=F8JKP6_STREN|nr:iron ABC transporter permease [Streptantibioticus cattleyicolor]AEW98464.1 Fe uptake system integral membrane protein [Streptantibioticus cattleyicolor NRRL 8057 = DSM 46488]CCB72480.1 Fe uptake system integral membrane protein [Streptantibioticus cattleyicolor NRRL 8057 = DSM 46488]
MTAVAARAEETAPRRRRPGRVRLAVVLVVLALLLAASVTAGLAVGSVRVPPGQVWAIVTHALGADRADREWSRARETIVLQVRAPRVLLGAVTGAGLAVVGTAMQALVRNPLAEPYLLGVSSGASLGAVAVIVFGVGLFGPVSLSVVAFAGALGALFLVYATARTGGRITSVRLVLSGVAVAAVLTAVTDLLLLTTDRGNEARAVLAWTLGGLGGVSWGTLWLPGAALLLGVGVLMARARQLNLLLAGEEAAAMMGLDVARFRGRMFVLLSLVTGVLVAAAGPIGFVGLMLPHVVRLFVGGDHRRVLPTAALAGAVFLGWADIAARTVAAPTEIPVGVVTALCGGPFFLWLMRRDARRGQDGGAG